MCPCPGRIFNGSAFFMPSFKVSVHRYWDSLRMFPNGTTHRAAPRARPRWMAQEGQHGNQIKGLEDR